LLITGIVVAFSATALAVAVLLRLHDETGTVSLSAEATGAESNAEQDVQSS
jgi:multicomponent Na+:H+ antiporter subunit C